MKTTKFFTALCTAGFMVLGLTMSPVIFPTSSDALAALTANSAYQESFNEGYKADRSTKMATKFLGSILKSSKSEEKVTCESSHSYGDGTKDGGCTMKWSDGTQEDKPWAKMNPVPGGGTNHPGYPSDPKPFCNGYCTDRLKTSDASSLN